MYAWGTYLTWSEHLFPPRIWQSVPGRSSWISWDNCMSISKHAHSHLVSYYRVVLTEKLYIDYTFMYSCSSTLLISPPSQTLYCRGQWAVLLKRVQSEVNITGATLRNLSYTYTSVNNSVSNCSQTHCRSLGLLINKCPCSELPLPLRIIYM